MRYETTVNAALAAPGAEQPSADCMQQWFCRLVYATTDNAVVAESSYAIVVKPLRIILIIMVALLVRFLLHRTINKLVRTTANGSVPTILKPLRERMPSAVQDATGLFPERRRQRAEAIGSVLRSFVSVVVFSIALLLVLSELGFDLAPLLASAGIAGIALGFGAQSLVKDLIAGLFMLLEDQYGVGDTVDVGEATGIVEAVGLRITTIRDVRGVLWYIRNGEIIRVGNKSQGWAVIMVDIPIGFAGVDDATAVLRHAAAEMAEDPEFADDLIEPPAVLGVEHISVDGAVVRTTAKTPADAQFRVGRELRRRLTEALESSGIAAQIAATRVFPRAGQPTGPPDSDTGGPT
jgi:small conductance mechanosensitive channel